MEKKLHTYTPRYINWYHGNSSCLPLWRLPVWTMLAESVVVLGVFLFWRSSGHTLCLTMQQYLFEQIDLAFHYPEKRFSKQSDAQLSTFTKRSEQQWKENRLMCSIITEVFKMIQIWIWNTSKHYNTTLASRFMNILKCAYIQDYHVVVSDSLETKEYFLIRCKMWDI